jgi:DNA-binding NtrC family response regulator
MTPKVLVVDDEAGLRMVLQDLLETEGYSVSVCHDTASARHELSSGQFHLALVDVFLSNQPEGAMLAREILRDYPNTGVILMTGFADTSDIEAAYAFGAFTCISKPFSLDDVLMAVESALANQSTYKSTDSCGSG